MNGLTSALSGMIADERLQQVAMNNISNISTSGFKESSGALMAFPQYLLQSYNYTNGQTIGNIGTVNNGVFFQEAQSNFTQGGITSTGQPFDLAIQDPLTSGALVYTQAAAGGAAGGKATLTNTLSIVVGAGGVVEAANGSPILPVDANGNPSAQGRIVANPKFKGAELFGVNGSPVYDAAGQPSFHIVDTKGQAIAGASARVVDATTSGLHALFAVENVDSAGKSQVALSRDGHFQVGSNHSLYNALGQRVLAIGANGSPILNSAIQINPNYHGSAYFGANGAPLTNAQGQQSFTVVSASSGQPLPGAKFGVTNVNVNSLQPLGATDYLPTATTVYSTSSAVLQPGSLESSNTSSTQALTDMLNIYNSYQADQKVIQSINTTMQAATTQVGTVQGL